MFNCMVYVRRLVPGTIQNTCCLQRTKRATTRPYTIKMEQLPTLPDIERVSPRVIRILGANPSKFTLQGTNTYLIGQGPKRFLLDTGEGKPQWLDSVKKALKDENASISDVILTHWHPDHVGGVPDARSLCPEAKVWKNNLYAMKDYINYNDGHIFRTEGATIKAFHSPGHTVDHMAFILQEEDAMFTGDNVLGHGTAVFEDLATYIDSLERMQHQFDGRAYPGHGQVIGDGKAKIREYISHRRQREVEVLEVLKASAPGGEEGWTSMEIVKLVYKAYPEHLWTPAEGGVKQVLGKLEGEGKVKQADGERWSLGAKAAL
ncbi:hypothetical protein DOTSEDRAFT_74851 [Dothistroma septosporum NZE10]|uniref:Metallo-beta-lactamase domain-containing protein n=1 Tax=Dothistroma septosporum (strain NZE10 / CBS 128990) TaxID=675120 RepID=N1PEZ2_DOTSN|nr:hypothetical protein DOTSEDRAFT_74851 [Dothistroma septosporum NZE10]